MTVTQTNLRRAFAPKNVPRNIKDVVLCAIFKVQTVWDSHRSKLYKETLIVLSSTSSKRSKIPERAKSFLRGQKDPLRPKMFKEAQNVSRDPSFPERPEVFPEKNIPPPPRPKMS